MLKWGHKIIQLEQQKRAFMYPFVSVLLAQGGLGMVRSNWLTD